MTKETKKVIHDFDDVKIDPRLVGEWSVMGLWNQYLTFGRDERKLVKRDYIWATEVGRSYFDRWCKMKAIPAEEEYNERTLRKFVAGDMFERVVGFVLAVTGMLKADNAHLTVPATKNTLKVTGRLDFLTGGKPKTWKEIETDPFAQLYFQFFEPFKVIAKQLHTELTKKYPNGLKPLIYEIKSVNSLLFWAKKDYLQEAYPHHQLQLLTYLKATEMDEGRVLYISKDDLTLAEFPVYANDVKLNEIWNKDVKEMSKFILTNQEPPKPDPIVFDERKKITFQHNKKKYFIKGCWTENWEIKWSNYIKQIGYKDEKDYKDKIKPLLKQKNDAIKETFKFQRGLV